MRTSITRITAGLVAFALVSAAAPAEPQGKLTGGVAAIEVDSLDARIAQELRAIDRPHVIAARKTRPRAHW